MIFLTLDSASELILPTGWHRLKPILNASLDKGVVSVCPPASDASACFGMLPVDVMVDDAAAVGWLMNMTLEPGSDAVEEEVTFGTAVFEEEEEEEEEVTRMNLVTWDLSSVLARFTPGLLINCACVGSWETPELLSEGTITVLFTSEAGN